MAEAFLEEQLRRIKEMSEQMSRVRTVHGENDGPNPPSDPKRSQLAETRSARRRSSRGPSRRRRR
jgi:hypothetical protein